MSEALTDALLRRAQSGWKDVWDAGKYAFGPEGYRDLKKNIRYYGGPHLGSTVNDVLDILPELMGPGADVRDMLQGSDALTKALMRRDGIGALEGGTQLFGGLLGLGVPGSVAMFAGPGARNANMGALRKAEGMAEQGADPRKIWDETGWFQGADGKWRFEIDDSAATLADEMNSLGVEFDRPLGDLVQHQKAYTAYPDAADIHVETFGRSGKGNLPSGAYMADRDRMQVRGDLEGGALSTALHETQHAIQNREAFARGGSPGDVGPNALGPTPDMWVIQQAQMIRELAREWGGVDEFLKGFPDALPSGEPYSPEALQLARDPSEIGRQIEIYNINTDPVLGYKHLAGEVEARNVQTRREFTPDQRRAQPPWETEDVPRDRQIVRFR